eukprot:g867.t1
MYSNQILYIKEIRKAKQRHRNNLRHVKPTSQSNARKSCDSSRPERHKLLQKNGKRIMIQRERERKIQRENLILMRKLRSIKNRRTRKETPAMKRLPPKSSGHKREKDVRIARDNLRIMRSIRNQKGQYDVSAWKEERKKTKILLRRMKKDMTVGYLHCRGSKKTPSKMTTSRRDERKVSAMDTLTTDINGDNKTTLYSTMSAAATLNRSFRLPPTAFRSMRRPRKERKLSVTESRKIIGHLMQITATLHENGHILILIHDLSVFYRYKIELELPVEESSDVLQSSGKAEALLRELIDRVRMRNEGSHGGGELYIGASRLDATRTIQRFLRSVRRAGKDDTTSEEGVATKASPSKVSVGDEEGFRVEGK